MLEVLELSLNMLRIWDPKLSLTKWSFHPYHNHPSWQYFIIEMLWCKILWFNDWHGFHPNFNHLWQCYTKCDIWCPLVFHVTRATFWLTLFMNTWTKLSWMMDEFIHQLVKQCLLLSPTCDETMSCHCKSIIPPPKVQGMTRNFMLG